jgi:hypothetical protein
MSAFACPHLHVRICMFAFEEQTQVFGFSSLSRSEFPVHSDAALHDRFDVCCNHALVFGINAVRLKVLLAREFHIQANLMSLRSVASPSAHEARCKTE